jgi:hypothetical protein
MHKYAVLISGQPRNVQENFESIRANILEPNDFPDVFIHSWISEDIYGKQFYSPWIKYENLNEHHKEIFKEYKDLPTIPVCEPIPHNVKEIILDLYKPKNHLFEPQVRFEFDKKFYKVLRHLTEDVVNIRLGDALSMYYSTKMANELKKEYEKTLNFRYDYVIKIRFDLHFISPYVMSTYPATELTYSNHHWEHDICFTNFWAGAKSEIMDVYCDLFDSVLDIVESNETSFTDECILGQHIYKNGIRKNSISFPSPIMRLKDGIM